MAEALIISISGMRGIVGENLDASIAAEYGCAFGTFLKSNSNSSDKLTVAIGRDSRPSGQMVISAVTAGLCSAGVDVVDLGIVTTPTVGIMLRQLNCAGGVVVTASHNPVQYNGIKLLLGDGIAPDPEKAAMIKQIYLDDKGKTVTSVDCGKVSCCDDPDVVHIEKVLACVDADAISKKKFKVVLDSVNGAGGRAGQRLLEKLGCEVVGMNIEPTGIFAHTPEPTEANLIDLCSKVKSAGAVIGFAQDPDADRLAIVDENGRYIGEEYTLALAAKYMYAHHKGLSAANLSSSRMIDDMAVSAGCEVLRTAVGEANVANAMVKNKCIIGGEGNGGLIDLRVGPIRDSLIAMAMVLQLMTETDKTISQLVAEIPEYEMNKDKFSADSTQAAELIDACKKEFADAKVDTTDGVRFDFADGWVHLRTSNTEPVMRLISEFRKGSNWQGYIDRVNEIRQNIVG